MSNLLVNIRVGLYHFQLRRWGTTPWVEIVRNDYFAQRPGWPDGFFAVYQFFGLASRESTR